MASTPDEHGFIELHVGASELNLYAMAVMDRILQIEKSTWISRTAKPGCVTMKNDR